MKFPISTPFYVFLSIGFFCGQAAAVNNNNNNNKKTSTRWPEGDGHPCLSNMDVMKVIQRQESDDLLQFHKSIWIQYCWVGCGPVEWVERWWVESLSGVSLSSGWTSARRACPTALLSRSPQLSARYLPETPTTRSHGSLFFPKSQMSKANVAELTCGKPLLDEREAVSGPGQFNVTAWQRAALAGELHRQWSRLTGAFCELEAC